VTEDQLPPEVREAVFNLVPKDFVISRIIKSNFSKDKNISDYLVFYDNSKSATCDACLEQRLSIVRQNPIEEVKIFPVFRHEGLNELGETEETQISPDDLIIYQSWSGTVYAKTTDAKHSYCWESIISWQSGQFLTERIFFGTTDGFNYPVAPMDTQNPPNPNPVDIQTANFPSGWKIDQEFQDCKNYPPKIGPCKHLGVDLNGKGGGDTDLGYPVFAAGRGEVIFAGDAGHGWNGIVVLRHRPPTGEDIYSLYGHLNVDPNAKRPDGSRIRTLAEILQRSAPGRLVEVEKGQLIGYIGPRPTEDTYAHLHFEIITDPAVAYNTHQWVGYRLLHGSEVQWRNPLKFIEENRSYWTNFAIGEDWANFGISSSVFEECYRRNGGLNTLGQPISIVSQPYDELSDTFGPLSQSFQNGEIYDAGSASGGNAFAVLNPLLAKIKIMGPARTPTELPDLWGYKTTYITKFLGLPKADIAPRSENSFHGTKFKFQNFEGGALEFHQTGPYAGDVFEIHGAIFNRWSSPELNYAAGPLGLPISDEKEAIPSPISGSTGRYSVFEGGIIHWVREQDKTYVIGLNQNVAGKSNIGKLIADRYHLEGGSGGNLGFPISDDYLWQDGVRIDFENGYITWTPSDGIQVVVFNVVVFNK
jgi:murein DD-endopeptidase MepM/ murein hydrolase activator NlpD